MASDGVNATVSSADDTRVLKENLDQLFLIVMGMIVLLMQCGFAFLEAGAVRSKNSTNILIKNLLDSSIAGIAYWIIGFPLAFGSGNSFIGHEFWALANVPPTNFATFFFQYTFAATAATIVSGSMAERCEFVAYITYSFVLTGFIYPVVTHWVWAENGWLAVGYNYEGIGNVGYTDFAGSGAVHVLGGTAAFVGAAVLGPRRGRFRNDSNAVAVIRGHSVPLAALGGFILIFGFLAFNGGSVASISSPGDGAQVSLSVVNTIISGSVAALTVLTMNKIKLCGNRFWSLLLTINGALTGMVSACAGCNVMYPWGAALTGFFAAFSFNFWSWLMVKMQVDDPLDAVAVHFGGGMWGLISVAFLNRDEGILFKWDQKSGLILAWQLCGFVAITMWTGCICLVIFLSLHYMNQLRVSTEIEIKGLDIPKHGEPAYPVESYGHGWIERILQILEEGTPSLKGEINKSIKAEISDVGPYEHPEVNAQRNVEPQQPVISNTKL